jgi:hypothetical protein
LKKLNERYAQILKPGTNEVPQATPDANPGQPYKDANGKWIIP